jgi:hypothetical protein
MFKYFINQPSKIVFTTGVTRHIIPLHIGLIQIDTSNIFKLNYVLDYGRSTSKDVMYFEKRYRDSCNKTKRIYKLQDRVIVDIPRVYFKNISISDCVLSAVWKNEERINEISVIPAEEFKNIFK